MLARTLEDVLSLSEEITIIGYADDHSIHCTYKSGDHDQEAAAIEKVEQSLANVKNGRIVISRR